MIIGRTEDFFSQVVQSRHPAIHRDFLVPDGQSGPDPFVALSSTSPESEEMT
jgi:hypothetical protein